MGVPEGWNDETLPQKSVPSELRAISRHTLGNRLENLGFEHIELMAFSIDGENLRNGAAEKVSPFTKAALKGLEDAVQQSYGERILEDPESFRLGHGARIYFVTAGKQVDNLKQDFTWDSEKGVVRSENGDEIMIVGGFVIREPKRLEDTLAVYLGQESVEATLISVQEQLLQLYGDDVDLETIRNLPMAEWSRAANITSSVDRKPRHILERIVPSIRRARIGIQKLLMFTTRLGMSGIPGILAIENAIAQSRDRMTDDAFRFSTALIEENGGIGLIGSVGFGLPDRISGAMYQIQLYTGHVVAGNISAPDFVAPYPGLYPNFVDSSGFITQQYLANTSFQQKFNPAFVKLASGPEALGSDPKSKVVLNFRGIYCNTKKGRPSVD
jgi:hypothetical protein